jgi:hypothetical protein
MKKIGCLFISLYLFSCTPGREAYYNISYPISESSVSTLDNHLSLNIPQDWSVIKNDNNSENICIILSDRDFSASFVLSELKASYVVRELIKEEGLELLGRISFEMQNKKTGDSLVLFSAPYSFSVGGNEYCAYEYYNKIFKNNITRVVIIDSGDKYYDFIAFALPYEKSQVKWQNNRLFSIQQSVLKTIKWKKK